jgi:hypothetical protein
MNLICDMKDRIGRIQINGVHLKWDLESKMVHQPLAPSCTWVHILER